MTVQTRDAFYLDVARLVRTQPTVSLDEAAQFLGMAVRSDAAYRMAAKYRKRIAKAQTAGRVMLDTETIRPRRNNAGEWVELANVKFGSVIRCRTDMLLWMVYPESRQ